MKTYLFVAFVVAAAVTVMPQLFANKDVTAVGRGPSQAKADQKAFALLLSNPV
jgi:hypothetical protein